MVHPRSTSEIKAPNHDLKSLAIDSVMTIMPVTVDEDTNLVDARHLFKEHGIRHLPVTHNDRLTGILSERDTRIVELMPAIKSLAVADVMSRKPVTVPETCSVFDALTLMVEGKYGCLLVNVPGGKVTGIFTVYDALRLLLGEKELNFPAPTAYPMVEDDDE